MGSVNLWQLLILLAIILLLFGTKKLRNIGADLGNAIKGFRSAVKDGEGDAENKNNEALAHKKEDRPVVEAEVDKKKKEDA